MRHEVLRDHEERSAYVAEASEQREEVVKSGIVYLICFDRKYHHARHYLGFCEDGNLEKRMDAHMMGSGSKLLRAVVEAGIGWKVVQLWEGDRSFERKLKRRKNSGKLCPCCRGRKP